MSESNVIGQSDVGVQKYMLSNTRQSTFSSTSGFETLGSVSNRPERHVTPKEYREVVKAHANRSTASTLYPGQNFGTLATYLMLADAEQDTRRSSPSRSKYTPSPSIPFTTLLHLSTSGEILFEQPQIDKLLTPLQQQKEDVQKRSRILFMRGQPSSEWLSSIGATYWIDPEFYQRHLDFRSTFGRLNYFSLPSLPSASESFIQLRYFTFGQRGGHHDELDQTELDAARKASTKAMDSYRSDLNKSIARDRNSCDSIVRGYFLVDQKHFAIEQAMTICLSKDCRTGNDLSHGPVGPWTSHLNAHKKDLNRHGIFPTIQIRPFIALKPNWHSADSSTAGTPVQSASLLHTNYGRTRKPAEIQTMACDPFYAVHELFIFCAFTEVQFLNMLECKLTSDANSEHLLDQNLSESNLIYSQEILVNHIERLRDNIEIIKALGGSRWPRPADNQMLQRSERAAESLKRDYEHLLSRAVTLSERCKDKMNSLMNRAMIAESNKAILQAQEVTKLTQLAFVFIPLSFVASFFGMNLGPLVNAPVAGIWLYFAVSFPMVMLSLAIMKWDFWVIWKKITRRKAKTT